MLWQKLVTAIVIYTDRVVRKCGRTKRVTVRQGSPLDHATEYQALFSYCLVGSGLLWDFSCYICIWTWLVGLPWAWVMHLKRGLNHTEYWLVAVFDPWSSCASISLWSHTAVVEVMHLKRGLNHTEYWLVAVFDRPDHPVLLFHYEVTLL